MSVRLMKIANSPDAPAKIKEIRKIAKRLGFEIVVRGRCKDRRAAFAKTGRHYSSMSANLNDIYLGSPEAQYADSWVLYRKELPIEYNMYRVRYDIREFVERNGIQVIQDFGPK